MAHSIESRVPFLDHELVEFCFAMPDEFKISRGITKVVLREAMKGVIPEPVRMRHSKLGFSTPQSAWFRGALSPLLESVVQSKSFADRGYIDVDLARQLFARHKNGEIDISTDLWKWANLELWMRRYID